MLWLFCCSLLVSGTADYLLKVSADASNTRMLPAIALIWCLNVLVWYKLYKLEKFIVLAGYYVFFSVIKDIVVSQGLLREALSYREISALILIFTGTILLSVRY